MEFKSVTNLRKILKTLDYFSVKLKLILTNIEVKQVSKKVRGKFQKNYENWEKKLAESWEKF